MTCTGVGLHSGTPVNLTLCPAPANHGHRLRPDRSRAPVEIPARSEFVVDTSLATTLGKDGVQVGTVEHLLAALAGLGIDNLRVELDGPEVPIMDGTAAPFAYLLQPPASAVQDKPKSFLVIKTHGDGRDGDKEATLSPATQFTVSCTIDFKHPLITDQSLRDGLLRPLLPPGDLARARTFGFLRDVEMLKKMGLARGGSLENAIVVDDFRILNPDGLRFPDEFVRHKVLDAIGDVSLFGMPVIGHLKSHKSGHALNHKLVQKVLGGSLDVRDRRRAEARSRAPDVRLPDLGALEALVA